jgi:hypothetical protein
LEFLVEFVLWGAKGWEETCKESGKKKHNPNLVWLRSHPIHVERIARKFLLSWVWCVLRRGGEGRRDEVFLIGKRKGEKTAKS